jgi:hypothetical protein
MVAGNVANARFNFQASQGTPAATSAYGVQLAGGSLPMGMGENAYFEETTGAQMRSDVYAVNRSGGGTFEVLCRPKAIAGLLYAILGTDTPSGASDPWTHAITHNPTMPWLTWWSHLGGLDFDELSDSKLSQLVISGESGQPLRASCTLVSMRPRHQTTQETAAAVEIGDALVFYDGDGALLLEGAAVASIGSFTCTINRNVIPVYGDGLTPIDLAEGLFTVEWQIGRLYASSAIRKRVMYGAASPGNDAEVVSTVLALAGSPAGVNFKFTMATGPERSLRLACPTVTVDPYEIAPNTDGSPLRETLNLRVFDDNVSEPITATVLNSMADLTP